MFSVNAKKNQKKKLSRQTFGKMEIFLLVFQHIVFIATEKNILSHLDLIKTETKFPESKKEKKK